MTFNVGGMNCPLEYKINRTRFNALCEPSFRCTMAIIDNVICTAGLSSQDQIDDIVNQGFFLGKNAIFQLLVGGSTRIPRIRELIHEKFPRAKILQNVNPDEAIAIGAAIYAAQLERRDKPVISSLLYSTPLFSLPLLHSYIFLPKIGCGIQKIVIQLNPSKKEIN